MLVTYHFTKHLHMQTLTVGSNGWFTALLVGGNSLQFGQSISAEFSVGINFVGQFRVTGVM